MAISVRADPNQWQSVQSVAVGRTRGNQWDAAACVCAGRMLLGLARVAEQAQEEGDRELDAPQRGAVPTERKVHVVLDVGPPLVGVNLERGGVGAHGVAPLGAADVLVAREDEVEGELPRFGGGHAAEAEGRLRAQSGAIRRNQAQSGAIRQSGALRRTQAQSAAIGGNQCNSLSSGACRAT